jgi:hypothetical protein
MLEWAEPASGSRKKKGLNQQVQPFFIRFSILIRYADCKENRKLQQSRRLLNSSIPLV